MADENKREDNSSNKNKVRRILAHSHSVFFLLFLAGVALDLVFRVTIFANSIMMPIGFLLLAFGSLLIFWAETTSHNFKENISKESFYVGPYRHVRNPVHWGLFLLVLGFGFIINAFFVILCVIVAFLIEKFIFQIKAEKILADKYGAPYLEYKKSVRF